MRFPAYSLHHPHLGVSSTSTPTMATLFIYVVVMRTVANMQFNNAMRPNATENWYLFGATSSSTTPDAAVLYLYKA